MSGATKYLITNVAEEEKFSQAPMTTGFRKMMTHCNPLNHRTTLHFIAEFIYLSIFLAIYQQLIMAWLPVCRLIAAVSQQLPIISASTLTLRTNWITEEVGGWLAGQWIKKISKKERGVLGGSNENHTL